MAGVPAVLHDLAAGTLRRVTLTRDASALRARGEGVDRQVPLEAVRLSGGGWSGDAAHLAWSEQGREWALTVTGPGDVAALAGLLPEHLAAEAQRLRDRGRRAARRGRLTLGVLAAFLLAPFVALGLAWWLRESLVDAAVQRLPRSVDVRLGEAALLQVRQSHRLVETGPAVEAVRAIGNRLVAASGSAGALLPFRFEIAEDATANAFAAPGGLVVVHTGLLAASSTPDEIAGVLAHEISHVTERHSLRQLVVRAGLAAALRLLLGSPDGAAAALGGALSDLGALRFGREQEQAADLGALGLLQAAGLPPAGLVGFFDRLAQKGGGPPAFLSSHPAPDDRAARLQAEIARRGEWVVRPIEADWDAVRASLPSASPR